MQVFDQTLGLSVNLTVFDLNSLAFVRFHTMVFFVAPLMFCDGVKKPIDPWFCSFQVDRQLQNVLSIAPQTTRRGSK